MTTPIREYRIQVMGDRGIWQTRTMVHPSEEKALKDLEETCVNSLTYRLEVTEKTCTYVPLVRRTRFVKECS